jgi:YD repeat-containing protein
MPLFRKLRASLLILASLLLSLATHAQDYTYDALNRLTTVTTPDGHPQVYHYDAAGNLLSVTTSDLPRVTDCLLYAVHDDGRSDSQLFTLNPYQNFEVKLLGELHRHYDIEALDLDPTTDQLFAGAGADGLAPGALYTVNLHTGELTLVGPSGFSNLHGISFRPDGSLWGWASGAGLIQSLKSSSQKILERPCNMHINSNVSI